MRFISVRDLRERAGKLWKELPEAREMVITNNGRPVAILAAVNESNLEESLAAFRKARAVEAVASLQRRSTELGTDRLTQADIDKEISQVRRSRKSR
jgi:antitoxin (DNA-binding transcriptional repressor) of toxin-antitoxin stability system